MYEELSNSDIAIYRESTEIHAAVHIVELIAKRYRMSTLAPDMANSELRLSLIRFFVGYDRTRTGNLEALKARILTLLMGNPGWSVPE
jgi:hypothetical protein